MNGGDNNNNGDLSDFFLPPHCVSCMELSLNEFINVLESSTVGGGRGERG